MVAVSNIMVTICIMFSVPILHYPCRFSLWNLLHQMIPRFVPAAFDNGDPSQDYKSLYRATHSFLTKIISIARK